MKFTRIVTANSEERWINLHQITRVSVSQEAHSGHRILIITFVGGDRVTIHGTCEQDEDAISHMLGVIENSQSHAAMASAA